MGIESRLLHYIESALSACEATEREDQEYRPDRLLPKLERINPKPEITSSLSVFEQGGMPLLLNTHRSRDTCEILRARSARFCTRRSSHVSPMVYEAEINLIWPKGHYLDYRDS